MKKKNNKFNIVKQWLFKDDKMLFFIMGAGITFSISVILTLMVVIPVTLSTINHPTDKFDLPKNTQTKIHYAEGINVDSIVNVTIKNETLIFKSGKKVNKYPDLKFEYWYVNDKTHTLTWSNDKLIVQYKSIGFKEPHSIDIFKLGSKGRTHEQFVF